MCERTMFEVSSPPVLLGHYQQRENDLAYTSSKARVGQGYQERSNVNTVLAYYCTNVPIPACLTR